MRPPKPIHSLLQSHLYRGRLPPLPSSVVPYTADVIVNNLPISHICLFRPCVASHLTQTGDLCLHAKSRSSLFSNFPSSRRLSTVAVTATTESNGQALKDEPALLDAPSSSVLCRASQILKHYSRCYWELSKARLSMLVVTTAGTGFVMGSGLAIDYCGLSWTCLGTFCVAAAANTFNQVLEVENDSKMKRTKSRPLPSGRITTEHAMAWGLTTSSVGIALLASEANMIAAGLGAINLVLYTLVYTPLKQIHPMNTWIGAVVGAVPPLLGWAAAAGEVTTGGWLLASVLYFWQIPHFMAIAYMCRKDYAAGGFKMLSMEDTSGKRTALAALRNCVYLAPLGYLAYQCGMTSQFFGVETALLSAGMGTSAALFYFRPSNDNARKLFRVSLLYLPFVLVAMLAHRHPYIVQAFFDDDEDEEMRVSNKENPKISESHGSRPPVANFSVAPFPFLPVPDFTPT